MARHVLNSFIEVEREVIQKIINYFDSLSSNEYEDFRCVKMDDGCYDVTIDFGKCGLDTVSFVVRVEDVYKLTRDADINRLSILIEKYLHDQIFDEVNDRLDSKRMNDIVINSGI